jgi:hypothetical protein
LAAPVMVSAGFPGGILSMAATDWENMARRYSSLIAAEIRMPTIRRANFYIQLLPG